MDKRYSLYDFGGEGGVYWDDEIQSVILVAPSGAAAGEVYRYRMETLLKGVIEKKSKKILAELAALEKIEPEDLVWTETDWLPRVAAAGIKSIAVLLPRSLTGHLSLDQLTASVNSDKLGYERRFFPDIDSAEKWLKSR